MGDDMLDEPNNPTTKNNKASQRKCREYMHEKEFASYIHGPV